MQKHSVAAMLAVFVIGIAVGAVAAKRGIDPSMYHSKSKQEAGKALLEVAKVQAGKGSWERIGVGRVYYLGGMKAEGQKIFDEVTSKKPEPTDWWRIGRVYYEAGEWEKAKTAFDNAMKNNQKDDKGWAQLGAFYNLKGDRAKAEELFDKSFDLESGEVWNTAAIAGSYLGVMPQE